MPALPKLRIARVMWAPSLLTIVLAVGRDAAVAAIASGRGGQAIKDLHIWKGS